ncbi:hypothetical protein KL867_00420 [Ruegeria litorea]|uniref:DNA-binding protein n=1 Tax=Falsiruegeria litorea TaxID=1280831 RepID=A0ABS5WK57_9RHOB|nr:hypothetical protein [Falsiruegeria litorea]MBT3139505.1 hypothetical protein [Falsiruegeria litorea]
MFQETKPAFTEAANVRQLGHWLGMSRNRVKDFADALGVLPAGKKYPEFRLITGVLGVDVAEADIEPMTHKLMTLAEAAVILGYSAQDLKTKIEEGAITVPPMYVFGKRSRRFLPHQFLAFSRNPRGHYDRYDFLPGFLMSGDELAQEAEQRPDALKEKFKADNLVEPAHVILEGGKKIYIRAHAKTIFKKSKSLEKPDSDIEPPVFSGGVLGQIARSAASGSQA